MICPFCNTNNVNGALTCNYCGKSLIYKQVSKIEVEIPDDLLNYLKIQLVNGFAFSQIKTVLLDVGWEEQIVDQAYLITKLNSLPNQIDSGSSVQQKLNTLGLPSLYPEHNFKLGSLDPLKTIKFGITGKSLVIKVIIFTICLIGILALIYHLNKSIIKGNPNGVNNSKVGLHDNLILTNQTPPAIDSGLTGYHDDTLSNFTATDLKKLGVIALPNKFSIQEEYKGIKFVSSPKRSFTSRQIKLLKMFIDLTPYKLLTPGPSAVINYDQSELGIQTNPQEAAFASGTYMFFNDKSFNQSDAGLNTDGSIDTIYTTFEHELTHISQFNNVIENLDKFQLALALSSGKDWTDLVTESDFIKSFANLNGWNRSFINNKISYNLINNNIYKTTNYGQTGILEDMAETVSGIINSKDYEFSANRLRWGYDYLNESKDSLIKDKFPFSSKFDLIRLTIGDVSYDKNKENLYKSKYDITDLEYFVDNTFNDIDSLAFYFQTELNSRGWNGKFIGSIDIHGVRHFTADFIGAKRDIYIELVSYDTANDYITKPKGTIIVTISGYKI